MAKGMPKAAPHQEWAEKDHPSYWVLAKCGAKKANSLNYDSSLQAQHKSNNEE